MRGAGDGEDSLTNTIIYGRGNTPAQRDLITIGGGTSTEWADSVKGTKTNITTAFVPVGSRTFTVASAATYAVGDNIIIYHPCTDAWLKAVNYGNTIDTTMNWTVGSVPIFFNRMITAINGNDITVDAPIFNHLDKSLSQCFIYKYSRSNLKTNLGIENLRVEIETLGGTDENHAWNSIVLTQLEDAWIKHCTMLHFGYSGILTQTASRVTVDSCQALDPVSVLTGERRDNFNVKDASQLILMKNCIARNGRHHYVSTGTGHASGDVFLNCLSIAINNASEGHRHWSQGLLYDNLRDSVPGHDWVLGLYNRGSDGSGHGWSAVHSVAWNCNAGGKSIIIQQPPTGQNYGIGCFGTITGNGPYAGGVGYIEGSNKSGLNPTSLYLAQLSERLQTIDVKESGTSSKTQADLEIVGNYPNPFNPSTKIRWTQAKDGYTIIRIYDMLGCEIITLMNEYKLAGEYAVQFYGGNLASGVYFCKIRTGNYSAVRKIVLQK